jgi:hypothetical protein
MDTSRGFLLGLIERLIGVVAVLLFWPTMLLAYFLIRVTSNGPVVLTDEFPASDGGIAHSCRLLSSPQDGLHGEASSLSPWKGERVRERGSLEEMKQCWVNVFKAFPSPRPSPHSCVAGRGRRGGRLFSACFVVYPADCSVRTTGRGSTAFRVSACHLAD